ncbi:hypothetical protein ACVIHH_008472 [Bradyrhizobium sp. USDA 4518]
MLREQCPQCSRSPQLSLLAQHKSGRNITRIAIPAGFARDVLLPQDRQRYVLALELAMHRRPVWLGLPPMAPPGAGSGAGEQPGFQHRVGDIVWQRPGQPRRAERGGIVNRTVEGAVPTCRAISRVGISADFNLITSRTWRIANLSVGIQVPFAKPKGGTVAEPEEASSPRATSSRNGGRDHSGTVDDTERNQQGPL